MADERNWSWNNIDKHLEEIGLDLNQRSFLTDLYANQKQLELEFGEALSTNLSDLYAK